MSYLSEGNMNLWEVDFAIRSSVSLLSIDKFKSFEFHPGLLPIWNDIISNCKAIDL